MYIPISLTLPVFPEKVDKSSITILNVRYLSLSITKECDCLTLAICFCNSDSSHEQQREPPFILEE